MPVAWEKQCGWRSKHFSPEQEETVISPVLDDPGHGFESWISGLAALCERIANDRQLDDAGCLKTLIALMQSAPDDILASFGYDPAGWWELERLLSEDATEAVAIRLMGEATGFMVSRGSDDRFLASLSLPGLADEVDAYGNSLAQAITCVIALATIRLLTA